MRRAVLIGLGLLVGLATQARPLAVVVAPDPPFHGHAADLIDALVDHGGYHLDDIHIVADDDALAELLAGPELEVRGSDRLTIVLAGRLEREAGAPVLVTRGDRMPLDLMFALFAQLEPETFVVLAGLVTGDETEPLRPLEAWPEASRPVAMLVGEGEAFLREAVFGLTWLFADDDADGVVDARELHEWADRRTDGPPPALASRPSDRTRMTVSGERSPDVTAPLVLVTSPELGDGPVRRERPGALRVRGVVADDRKIASVTINAMPAMLLVATDPADPNPLLPGRALTFETSLPLPPAGRLEVEVTATDLAGNLGRERFSVWVGSDEAPAAPLPEPSEPAAACSVDAVWFDWGLTEDWRYGFRVHFAATVRGRIERQCRAVVQFHFADGTPVMDFNGQYADTRGQAVASVEFKPRYDNTVLRDLVAFMPQRELHLEAGRQHRLSATVVLVDVAGEAPQPLAHSAPQPFELSEPAQGATVLDFAVEHNQREGNQRGLRLVADFHTVGVKDRPCQVAVYVQYADGKPMLDRNGRYRAGDGTVAVFRDVAPGYDSARYRDFALFLPYDELHLAEPGEHKLRARVVVWDKGAERVLDASTWTHFTVNQG